MFLPILKLVYVRSLIVLICLVLIGWFICNENRNQIVLLNLMYNFFSFLFIEFTKKTKQIIYDKTMPINERNNNNDDKQKKKKKISFGKNEIFGEFPFRTIRVSQQQQRHNNNNNNIKSANMYEKKKTTIHINYFLNSNIAVDMLDTRNTDNTET